MTSTGVAALDQKIASLARDYEQRGYAVFREPGNVGLPFDLGSYKPDIVARKGDEGLIIEVKASTSRISIDQFQELAETVREHPGWRFLLVTLQDLPVSEDAERFLSWNELKTKLAQARMLVSDGMFDAAALYAWAIFEAAMRKRAVATATPVERLPATTLMSHLYTLGHMDVDAFAIAKEFLALRNPIAHGLGTVHDDEAIEKFLQIASRLLSEWSRTADANDSGDAATH